MVSAAGPLACQLIALGVAKGRHPDTHNPTRSCSVSIFSSFGNGRGQQGATWPALDPVLRAIVTAESSSGAVNQFLTGDAIANPWNGFEALGVNLLPAVETLTKCAVTDPFQCGIY